MMAVGGGARCWRRLRRDVGGRASGKAAKQAAKGEGGARRRRASRRLVQRQRRGGALVVAAGARGRARRSRSWRVGDGGGELAVTDPQGGEQALTAVRRDGPPVQPDAPTSPRRAPGSHQLIWTPRRQADRVPQDRRRGASRAAPATAVGANVWPSAHAWDRRYENFYSAWIATLFDAPVDQSLDFRPLHQALRDPARNFLYGYLGLREDDPKNKAAIPATPDCADLPYFLRAYFSWKLGLPFGFRDCDRGTESRPPRCTTFYSNDDAPTRARTRWRAVKCFFRQLANRVQSGSARTGARRRRDRLLPGAARAHGAAPGRHLRRSVRPRDGGGEVGRPDGRTRAACCWPSTASPTRRSGASASGRGRSCSPTTSRARAPASRRSARWRAAPTASWSRSPTRRSAARAIAAHAPFSDEQKKVSADGFYARMGKLINPAGLDAEKAYRETLDALVEQLTVRVGSVDNGEKYQKEKGGRAVDPDARRREDLRDHRPVGGLRDAVARHAAADRDERAARRCPSGSSSTPSSTTWAARSRRRCATRSRSCTRA